MTGQPSLERILNFRFRNDLLPIFLAPMAGIVGTRLAGAIADAGGYAILPVSCSNPREIRRQVQALKREGTRNFAVSLSLRQEQWARLFCCLEEGVGVVHFFQGDAASYVATVKELGGRVIQTVSDTDQAKRALDLGIDILVIQRGQANGFVLGDVEGSALLHSVVELSGSVPVIWSGGISDGQGIATAACLGLSGAMLSGRFIPCMESDAHELNKKVVPEPHREGRSLSKNLEFLPWGNASHYTFTKGLNKAQLNAGNSASDRQKNTACTIGQNDKEEAKQNKQICRPAWRWGISETEGAMMQTGQRDNLEGYNFTARDCMAELAVEYRRALSGINN